MKSETIHIGSVKVPVLDYAVSCNAILGIRDSGKTVTAKGIAEQLLDHDIPIVVFDAVGKWRWMKVAGEGPRGKAYKVVVAGGRAPDVALSPHSVGEIVRSAVQEKIPLIIDLYDPKLSKADWRRIVQQSIRIIHYEANGVAHVFLEEAAEFIPQKVMDGETYAEVEKLARMGGNASVGITIINQRSQEVNKAVLDLSHNLILGCQIGNKAIEAVEKWVDRLAPDIAKEVTTSLPHLKSGEAWVWTRTNPDDPKREKLPMCRSLHPDRRTPDVVLKSARPVDINQFVQQLNASIPKLVEEAKANDPAELKRKIRELEKELAVKLPAVKQVTQEIVEVSVLTDEDRTLILTIKEAYEHAVKWGQKFLPIMDKVLSSWSRHPAQLPRQLQNPPAKIRTLAPMAQSNGEIGRCERAILTALAQYPKGRTAVQVALLSEYSASSGGFNNSLGKLRSSGLITRGTPIHITAEGTAALGHWEPLPEGRALVERWIQRSGRCEATIISKLLEVYPDGMNPDELGEATGYAHTSGGFNNSLGRLRTLEVISRGRPITLNPDLFQ